MESFSIKNIKSFKDEAEIQIKPITIFVGKNSCGKSSLIRFPVVLSQTISYNAATPLKFYGRLIDYGNYEDVVFNHQKEPIEFSIGMQMDISNRIQNIVEEIDEHGFEKYKPVVKCVENRITINKHEDKLFVEKNVLWIDGKNCYEVFRQDSHWYAKVHYAYDISKDAFSPCEYEVPINDVKEKCFFTCFDSKMYDGFVLNALFEDLSPSELMVENDVFPGMTILDYYDLPFAIRKDYQEVGKSEEEKNREEKRRKQLEKEKEDSKKLLYKYEKFCEKHDLKKIIENIELPEFDYDGVHKAVLPDSDRVKEYVYVALQFKFYEEVAQRFMLNAQSDIGNISYIGPFRNNPERLYRDEEIRPRQVGVKGENSSTVLIRDYQSKKIIISDISEWLRRTMGYSLVVDELASGMFRILLEDEQGIMSNIMDVGYGVSQILPILIQVLKESPDDSDYIYSHKPNDILIVEQPELHLHPAAQSELADLFVTGALLGNKKMLIETHSEHLIRKLQVLISDPNCELTCDDVAIYYVDKCDDGSAIVNHLKILPNGKFEKKWPSGFFDKAHELSMELLKNQ